VVGYGNDNLYPYTEWQLGGYGTLRKYPHEGLRGIRKIQLKPLEFFVVVLEPTESAAA
jgi:hypothetical protein